MKHLLIFIILLPCLAFSQGKTHTSGYIVTANQPNDTLFGDEIYISLNSFSNVKLKVGKDKAKFEKKDLIDYGYIREKDKKRVSKYAEKTFLSPTYKGAYLLGVNQDTVHCYIQRDELKGVFQTITTYDRNYITMNGYKELSFLFVKSFMIVNDDGKEIWYDAIRMELENFEVYGLDETTLVASYIRSFAIRLNDGKIRLNETQARIRGILEPVYVLEKDYKTTIIYIENGLLNINAKEKLGELLSDAPHLLEKLHKKGYEYHNIEEIIREYNEFHSK